MLKALLKLLRGRDEASSRTSSNALTPDEAVDDRRRLQESGAIVDQLVALALRREPVPGQLSPQHEAIFSEMNRCLQQLGPFGAYIIPKISHDLGEAKSDHIRKIYLNVLAVLDQAGYGLNIIVTGFKHRNSLVRKHARYGATQILMSLTENSIALAARNLPVESRRQIIAELSTLSRDPSEHPRLREMTQDTLNRALRNGLHPRDT